MGATIWVDVQGRADDETPADNSTMLQLEEQLDKLARKIGVEKLTGFYDYSAAEDDLADLLDDAGDDEAGDADATTDPEESAPARGNWFEIQLVATHAPE